MKIKDLESLAGLLPKQTFAHHGRSMEPINVIILGSQRQIVRHFLAHGWFLADRLRPLPLARALIASVFNLSYQRGPLSDSYIVGRRFSLGFEKPTRTDTFRRRHHLRLWRTRFKLNGKTVWIGTVSYDRSAGLASNSFPTHHIAPTLSWEEKFLAHSLGDTKPGYIRLAQPFKGQLNNGDTYDYDGQALVLNLPKQQVAGI